MNHTAAIYGFEFTRPFVAGGLTFSPIERQHSTAKKLARDKIARNLTGIVSGPGLSPELVYQLEGVLSFIERLEVLVSQPVADPAAEEHPREYFRTQLSIPVRHDGGGAVLGPDAFNPWRDSRQAFIDLALNRLADPDFCKSTRLNSLLFKSVETFRQRRPFLEISYFLLISGLEGFCRAKVNDYQSKNGAEPITKALKSLGFNVYQENPNDLPRAISTYLHIRNALFHQGDFTATVKMNNSDVVLDCIQYLYNLQMLVSLTVMKGIGFDDGHTNWDCWIDRQPFR